MLEARRRPALRSRRHGDVPRRRRHDHHRRGASATVSTELPARPFNGVAPSSPSSSTSSPNRPTSVKRTQPASGPASDGARPQLRPRDRRLSIVRDPTASPSAPATATSPPKAYHGPRPPRTLRLIESRIAQGIRDTATLLEEATITLSTIRHRALTISPSSTLTPSSPYPQPHQNLSPSPQRQDYPPHRQSYRPIIHLHQCGYPTSRI